MDLAGDWGGEMGGGKKIISAVTTPRATSHDNHIFDINGTRRSKAAKGLNIINGKKVVITD